MLSDKDTLIQMFERANVVYSISNVATDEPKHSGTSLMAGQVKICVEACHTRPNTGYTGFYTDFVFNAAGMLMSIGAWE